jgi:hypothetical protein
MIVVEGADNSGKTTLARKMQLPYFSAGPAPTTLTELSECLKDQWNRAQVPCVQDRLTCVSQQVYSEAPESVLLQPILGDFVDQPGVVIVYCRPPERVLMDFSTHQVKSYDTEEHIEKLIRKQHEYIKKYDDLMATVPHVLYDWTEHSVAGCENIMEMLFETQINATNWKTLMKSIRMSTVRALG